MSHFREIQSKLAIGLQALFWVVLFRVGLWALPFARIHNLMEGRAALSGDRPAAKASVPIGRLARAVRIASQVVPYASCLTQAYALRTLLARYGYSSEIHIGVAKGKNNVLEAHAWIERNGQILIGYTDDFGRYTRLPSIDKDQAQTS